MRGKITSSLFYVVITFSVSLGLFTIAQAAIGTIDPANKYAWGTNIGWLNFAPTHGGGVTIHDDHLEGYVWAENVGWIRLGTHTAGSPHTYGNSSALDYGVNHDGSGNLSGYAWGTNIGWINFNPTHSQVTIDLSTGEFDGYAWSENVGWIHFKNGSPAYGVVTTFMSSATIVYLPLLLKDFPPPLPPLSPPDLVVESLVVSTDAVTVVIKNQGASPVNDAFWVEAYINPTTPPTAPNQEWHTRGGQGLVWGITTLPISAGQSVTLTLSSPSFASDQSSPLPVTIPAGSNIYAQVDSANTGVATGAVLEADETNNILGPVVSTVNMRVAELGIKAEGLEAALPERKTVDSRR